MRPSVCREPGELDQPAQVGERLRLPYHDVMGVRGLIAPQSDEVRVLSKLPRHILRTPLEDGFGQRFAPRGPAVESQRFLGPPKLRHAGRDRNTFGRRADHRAAGVVRMRRVASGGFSRARRVDGAEWMLSGQQNRDASGVRRDVRRVFVLGKPGATKLRDRITFAVVVAL